MQIYLKAENYLNRLNGKIANTIKMLDQNPLDESVRIWGSESPKETLKKFEINLFCLFKKLPIPNMQQCKTNLKEKIKITSALGFYLLDND